MGCRIRQPVDQGQKTGALRRRRRWTEGEQCPATNSGHWQPRPKRLACLHHSLPSTRMPSLRKTKEYRTGPKASPPSRPPYITQTSCRYNLNARLLRKQRFFEDHNYFKMSGASLSNNNSCSLMTTVSASVSATRKFIV